MKKLSLLIGGIILSSAVMAQKPTDGAPMSLEGQLGLGFGTGSGVTFSSPAIRFRYWVTENIAARVTFGVDNTTNNFTVNNGPDLDSANGTYKTMDNNWTASLGGEYHFAGTDRLSPYAGVDISFGGGTDKTEGTDASGPATYNAGYTEETSTPYSTFGFSLVAGTDYYFAENFYVGLELGLYWMSTTLKEGEFTVDDTNPGPSASSTGIMREEDKFSDLNTMAPTGNFRLGWRF